MSHTHLDLALTITLDGPLAVGTGFRRGLVQRTIERDGEGLVCIPASSLKGRTRDAAEQLAWQLGLKDICRAPRAEQMCSIGRGKLCLVCRTFGTPGLSSRTGHTGLRWSDAHLLQEYRNAFREIHEAQVRTRTQVQLSRPRGVALEERLFTSEMSIENLTFNFGISGWVATTPIAGDEVLSYELMLLVAALKMVPSIGGDRSRGHGRCAIAVDTIKVNQHALRPAELLENLELLCDFAQEENDGN
jgi:CRISPR/Cas system CSM-associated protein Csm3 (group 7 of RAMP superfamily)